MLAIPLIQRVDILSLKLRTITVHTTRGTTINGVGVDVTSCCQVKIQGWSTKPENSTHASTRHETRSAGGDLHMDYSAIRLAAQHFIGKKDEEIEESIQKTISGHQRAIIGVLTVEQLYKERATFSKRVLDLCYDDMRNMGLTVVSYTVAEITDDHGYIEALGVTQTEFVKRTASEGAALHQSKAASNKAQQDALAHLEVNMQTEKKIQSDKLRAITEAKAQEEINRRVAVQEKAHDIAAAEQDAILLVKKQEARAAEAKAELLVAKEHVEKERLLKQQRVNTEADAKLYEAKVQAEGVRATTRAEADKLRDLGEANAAAAAAQIRLTGVAKADAQEEYIRRDGRAQAEAIREIGLAKVTVAKAEAEAIRAKGNAEMEILEKRLQLFKEQYVFIHSGYVYEILITNRFPMCGAFVFVCVIVETKRS